MSAEAPDPHELIHRAMEEVAPVPVEISEKPDDFEPIHPDEVELTRSRIQFDNFSRNTERLVEELQDAAYRDKLTEAPNRLALEKAVDSLNDSGRPYGIFLVDLDHFKDINDTIGHQAGDQTLFNIAQQIMGTLRKGESMFRIGGDEFLVLKDLSVNYDRRAEEDPDNASQFADRRTSTDRRTSKPAGDSAEGLMERIHDAVLDGVDIVDEIFDGRLKLTQIGASVGYAEHEDGELFEDTLERADEEMYAMKRDGR